MRRSVLIVLCLFALSRLLSLAQTASEEDLRKGVNFIATRLYSAGENARLLKANAGAALVLEGHCDERGTPEYNLALGQRRADAVAAYLKDLGVNASAVQTVSYGEEKPFAQGNDETAWSQNRRAHFRFQ